MADSRFIKATAFCGYDKTDVDKRMETLYSMIYNLKNEIRESKQIIRKYEEGFSQEKAYENALAVERAQLTQLQVKNEQLTEKNKIRKDELEKKKQENEALNAEIRGLKDELEELRLKQLVLQNNDTENLGIIFIEAKKSHDLIVNKAKSDAAKCESDVKQFADELIDETNRKVTELLANAEKKAAQLIADAQKKADETYANDENLRKTVLMNMDRLNTEINRIKNIMSAFNSDTTNFIASSKEAISSAQKYLVKQAEKPAKPENKQKSENIKPKNVSVKTETVQNNANAPKKQPAPSAPKQESEKNSQQNDSGINLDDLLKQAKELNKIRY